MHRLSTLLSVRLVRLRCSELRQKSMSWEESFTWSIFNFVIDESEQSSQQYFASLDPAKLNSVFFFVVDVFVSSLSGVLIRSRIRKRLTVSAQCQIGQLRSWKRVTSSLREPVVVAQERPGIEILQKRTAKYLSVCMSFCLVFFRTKTTRFEIRNQFSYSN